MVNRATGLAAAIGLCFTAHAQNGTVQVTGAMRNTMFNGQLTALVSMDSIATPGTFGLGPMAFLRGELMLLDGQCYVATATRDSTMRVEQRTDVGAPFFVHQHVEAWTRVDLPERVTDLPALDRFLTDTYGDRDAPFAFTMTGLFADVDIHLVDVPMGTEVHGPDDAHRGNKHFRRDQAQATAVGFFSTHHKAAFTHHDSNIHVHVLGTDRSWMGHAEALRFDPSHVVLELGLP